MASFTSTSRPAPAPTSSQPTTPAQLFYGARGRSGSIASSFARQQAASRDQAQSPPLPPLPPLPTSHSLPHTHTNPAHAHSPSSSSFPRSATFPSLASPIRPTFPGSPVRTTFGEQLPPILAGESFSILPHHPIPVSPARGGFTDTASLPPSPSSKSAFGPTQRNPSPLGHAHTLSLALPPSTRTQTPTQTHNYTFPSQTHSHPQQYQHLRSSSTVAEQIPLARLPSKQSREALLPEQRQGQGGARGSSGGKSGGSSPSFGAMLFSAGKRASLGFGAREKERDREGEKRANGNGNVTDIIALEKSSEEQEQEREAEAEAEREMGRDKEKGWGDSLGGIRSPRESIVRFTRARSRSGSASLEEGRSSGADSSSRPHPQPTSTPPPPLPHIHVVVDDQAGPRESSLTDGLQSQSQYRPSESSRPYTRRPVSGPVGWKPDSGPVVRDKKTKRVLRQSELIASESRWFCAGHLVTGGGTRRVPAKERNAHPHAADNQDDGEGWAYSDGTTYTYDGPGTGSSGPTANTHTKLPVHTPDRTKRGRLSLIPYPFVFSVVLVLGTSGAWMATTCVWWWTHESPALAAVGAWLVLLVVVSMARTAFTDPGIVPRNLDLSPAMEDEHTPYARDLYVRGVPVRVKYCMTCKTYRPLRSSHCRICDNCVDGCDHHCQWVNNCVGRRNYTAFLTFLIACFLAILLMAVTAALHIYLQTLPQFGSNTVRGAMRGTGAGSAAVFVVCAAVVWPVGTLLGYHVRLLALNVTTIEQLRNSAHAAALVPGAEGDGPGPNAFSLGRWTRNAAWGACRPAGLSWVEGWKPVRADQRVLLEA